MESFSKCSFLRYGYLSFIFENSETLYKNEKNTTNLNFNMSKLCGNQAENHLHL